MIPGPLAPGQILMLVWPHLVALIALILICFAVSYVKFMREEIRAT
jgi:ABC-2 type transport system permease protein